MSLLLHLCKAMLGCVSSGAACSQACQCLPFAPELHFKSAKLCDQATRGHEHGGQACCIWSLQVKAAAPPCCCLQQFWQQRTFIPGAAFCCLPQSHVRPQLIDPFSCSPRSATAHGHKLHVLLSAGGCCITSLCPLLQRGVAAIYAHEPHLVWCKMLPSPKSIALLSVQCPDHSPIALFPAAALVSRQYVDMSRIRIEGLLAAFPKLVGSGKQHTYVETENVRYVYQPMEVRWVLLGRHCKSEPAAVQPAQSKRCTTPAHLRARDASSCVACQLKRHAHRPSHVSLSMVCHSAGHLSWSSLAVHATPVCWC